MRRLHRRQKGQVLIFSLVFMLIIVAFGAVLISSVFVYSQNGRLAYAQERALHIAEGGIDKALHQLQQQGGGGYTGEAGTPLGDGEFTVTVASVGSTDVVESTGYIPNHVAPQAQRTVRVTLDQTTAGVSFIYGVQVGFGGLVMNNNSSIVGSVYSNGDIEGANGAKITGDAWVAGGVSPTPDQVQAIVDTDQNVGDITGETDAGQSFVPSVTQVISMVSLYIKRVNIPANATVDIVTDNAGQPSSVALGSGTLSSSSVGTSYGWVDVGLSSAPQLTAGQKYWIVLDNPAPKSTRYYIWGLHSNNGGGNGTGDLSPNWAAATPTWTSASGDFAFKTWMGAGVTTMDSATVGGDAHANTITNSAIAKDAYYQILTGTTVGGTKFPGSPDPGVQPMPVSDAVISDFESAAAAGGTLTPNGGVYTVNGSATLGPVKIEGDLVLGLNAVLDVMGPIWVDGNIMLSNGAQVNLDPAFGSDSTMIIADHKADTYAKGQITVTNDVQVNGSGTPGSYIMLLSTYANPTGDAININNNTQGAIFYSSAGNISVANNVALKEVIGYKLTLANNASVTYESGLANVHFTTGPSGGWSLKRGSWQIIN